MRITSGNHSIQLLQAQQAFQAKPAAKAQPQIATPEVDVASEVELPPPSRPLNPLLQKRYQEIQDIATKAGFVGLTERDIQRAYNNGESLFADYRV